MSDKVTLLDVQDYILELLDKEKRKNTGNDGFPIDWGKNRLLEACVDYLNDVDPTNDGETK